MLWRGAGRAAGGARAWGRNLRQIRLSRLLTTAGDKVQTESVKDEAEREKVQWREGEPRERVWVQDPPPDVEDIVSVVGEHEWVSNPAAILGQARARWIQGRGARKVLDRPAHRRESQRGQHQAPARGEAMSFCQNS